MLISIRPPSPPGATLAMTYRYEPYDPFGTPKASTPPAPPAAPQAVAPQPQWQTPEPATTHAWAPAPVKPARPAGTRRSTGIGAVLGVSLLSAALAAGG